MNRCFICGKEVNPAIDFAKLKDNGGNMSEVRSLAGGPNDPNPKYFLQGASAPDPVSHEHSGHYQHGAHGGRIMSKGLIICGYPGIGKSSCAGWNGAIALESSTFSQEMGMMNWIPIYVKTAIQLAEQGFTVLFLPIEKSESIWHPIPQKSPW